VNVVETQRLLVQALRDHLARKARDPAARVIETHISFVILAGRHAYKIKKAVDLGFLDFSTLALRRRYCREELRLNRRQAPTLYLDIVEVRGDERRPRVGGTGAVLEYAVRMARFPDGEQLDRVLAAGRLQEAQVDQIAGAVADFHAAAPHAPAGTPYGRLAAVRAPMTQNFEQLAPCVPGGLTAPELERLRDWTLRQLTALRGAIAARRRAGFVRECHGDLHLANMAWHDGALVVFDCIEFSAPLRWIDTASDLAFLLMDLDHRGHPELAARLLNGYLSRSGDYGALAVLDLYRVYRALVRAKVACIRASQAPVKAAAASRSEVRELAQLALGYAARRAPVLVITSGVSGSGKSWLAARLCAHMPAIWLRSDVERKRMAGLAATGRSRSGLGAGLYSARMNRRTYTRLRQLAGRALAAGHSVVVDAAFLRRADRAAFATLAERAGCAMHILQLEAPAPVLEKRITERANTGRDPSEATTGVLRRQLAARENLSAAERARAIRIDTRQAPDITALAKRLQSGRARHSL